ncbi:MAG TPA: vitamin B12 dependent methionine synthase [Anaerolineae bacterium]
MNIVTLTDIPFKVDFDVLLKHLHVHSDSEDVPDIRRMVQEAEQIARPKAAYQVSFVEKVSDRQVTVDSVPFTSRIMRVNLDPVHRVFPYMATCGMELQEWSNQYSDMLLNFWADMIKAMALTAATSAMSEHLQKHYMPGPLGTMNPGSLTDWPISEQKAFFHLFGDDQNPIGIRLSSTCLMTPNKSVTGLQFNTESQYVNCQLCPRVDCPGRRAPYDEMQYANYGMQAPA